jgi:hypothetical protein
MAVPYLPDPQTYQSSLIQALLQKANPLDAASNGGFTPNGASIGTTTQPFKSTAPSSPIAALDPNQAALQRQQGIGSSLTSGASGPQASAENPYLGPSIPTTGGFTPNPNAGTGQFTPTPDQAAWASAGGKGTMPGASSSASGSGTNQDKFLAMLNDPANKGKNPQALINQFNAMGLGADSSGLSSNYGSSPALYGGNTIGLPGAVLTQNPDGTWSAAARGPDSGSSGSGTSSDLNSLFGTAESGIQSSLSGLQNSPMLAALIQKLQLGGV